MSDHPVVRLADESAREWGERDRDASRSDTRGGPHQPSSDGASETSTGDAEAALREQIRELEAELERSEHRVQRVIDHYERLLAEKNRKLETDSVETTGESLSSLSAVLWWRAD